jgi:beta-galactosidase
MHLAVAYYPELRSQDSWAEDFAMMRAAGIRRVRMAEFAWSTMEPEPGHYRWDWLDDAISLAAEHDIETVLCTPTATPPIWLVEQHPEVLPVDRYGRRDSFGARQHRCYNAPAYVAASERIVRAMAARYGDHPHVVAWQLDNEFGGGQKRCYCDLCRRAFQDYLAERYETLDALNARWGTAFWSQTYRRWDQIPAPVEHANDLRLRHHPSLEMTFSRFSSQTITDYAAWQASLLRERTGVPITTNAFMFRWGDNLDWYALFSELDAVGIDLYTDQLYEIAFYADLCRSIGQAAGKPLWVLEYGSQLPNIEAGMDLLAAHGCEWLFFFKFNPTPAGQEQNRKHLLTVTGAPTENYEVVRAWSQRAPDAGNGAPVSAALPRVGMVYDFDSAWAYAIEHWREELGGQLCYAQYLIHTVYRTLFEMGAKVTFVRGYDDMAACDVLVVPWQIIYDPDLEADLIRYVEEGGRLVVTLDLFLKNEDNAYLTEVPAIYRALLDWQEDRFIDAASDRDALVVRTHRTGAGATWMVRGDLSREDWRMTLASIFEEVAVSPT